MSIRIETHADGQAYPITVCEHCHEPIVQASTGDALWPQRTIPTPGHSSQVRYTHKVCRAEYERLNKPPAGCQWAHFGLGLHLIAFCRNATERAEYGHEALDGQD